MIKNIVLVWASNNPEKFGNKILKNLVNKWYTVYPINHKEEEIEWIKCYKSLENFLEYNIDFDVINFVIRPNIVLKMLDKNLENIIDKKIWCQPWASNDEVIGFLHENWFRDYIVESCIMLKKLNK
jgi:predicted CoA-binding protein